MLSHRPARMGIIIFSAIALAIALYIMLVVNSDRPLPGCGEDECNVVLTSRWEQWAFLSVAHLGIGGYISMISAAILAGVVRLQIFRTALWAIMIVESLTGIGFILWLTFLQWVIIRQFCVFCLSSHVFGSLAYAIVLIRAPAWRGFYHARRRLIGTAAGLLMFMIAVHIFFPPNMMAAQPAEDLPTVETSEADALSTGMLQFGQTEPSRTVQLLNGNLTFDLYKVPVSGDHSATHVLVDISDYCCPSCRSLHRRMTDFKQTFDISMVIVHLPAPMNTDCNPAISRTPRGFETSCTLARLAMAVNRADPSKFAAYHHYLMKDRHPPSVADARAKAEALVGSAALATAEQDAEVQAWIENGLNLKRYLKATTLPKLVTSTKVISYSGGSRAAFRELMKEALGVTHLTRKQARE